LHHFYSEYIRFLQHKQVGFQIHVPDIQYTVPVYIRLSRSSHLFELVRKQAFLHSLVASVPSAFFLLPFQDITNKIVFISN
jgi:hypothetical protein